LQKEDDVRKYVIKRPLPIKEGKTKQHFKAPKIQRLITPVRLQVLILEFKLFNYLKNIKL